MGVDGVVIVISPLLSLMHDQVSALRARNVPAASSAESSSEHMAFEGKTRLLYTTPETALGRLRNRLGELHRRVGIKLLAIDEAHCVSEWGHDFRPEYQRLAELRAVLPGVPVMALTATATPRVQAEMVRNLQLGEGGGGRHVSVVSTFDRPNLYYTSMDRSSEEAEQVFRDLVAQSNSEEGEPSIVYVLTQKEAEKMADKLVMMGAHTQRVGFYHAGLSDKIRMEVSPFPSCFFSRLLPLHTPPPFPFPLWARGGGSSAARHRGRTLLAHDAHGSKPHTRSKISEISQWQKCFSELKISNPRISCALNGGRRSS